MTQSHEDGAKDKITIATAQEEHHIDIDNEADKIAVYDKEKHCLVEMNTGEGVMKVHALCREHSILFQVLSNLIPVRVRESWKCLQAVWLYCDVNFVLPGL